MAKEALRQDTANARICPFSTNPRTSFYFGTRFEYRPWHWLPTITMGRPSFTRAGAYSHDKDLRRRHDMARHRFLIMVGLAVAAGAVLIAAGLGATPHGDEDRS